MASQMEDNKTYNLEQKFKRSLDDFFNSLLQLLNNDPDIIAAKTILYSYKISDVINYFGKKIAKDEKEYQTLKTFTVYLNFQDDIYGPLPSDKIEKIRNIWKELDNENKNNVWLYFKLFVQLSIKHKKLQDPQGPI